MPDKKCFIDTNIWLYAFIRSDDHRKTEMAKHLVEGRAIATSSQVINELCVNLLKKANLREDEISGIIASFYNRYDVVEFSRDILLKASTLRCGYNFSYWDSLIVSSALHIGARLLYSEDMHNGLVVDKSLKIINPFN